MVILIKEIEDCYININMDSNLTPEKRTRANTIVENYFNEVNSPNRMSFTECVERLGKVKAEKLLVELKSFNC